MTAERNEAVYREATKDLSIHDQHMFAHRMVAVLSCLVSEEDWLTAAREVKLVGETLK